MSHYSNPNLVRSEDISKHSTCPMIGMDLPLQLFCLLHSFARCLPHLKPYIACYLVSAAPQLLENRAQTSSSHCRLYDTVQQNRSCLVQFVMRHAPGARALKFVRRLPLFKGLGDNNLITVASRMREKVYQVKHLPECILHAKLGLTKAGHS